MNGDNVVFGQLVQKLEQLTPNSSTLQDNQNEWSQCSTWTAGSKVGIFLGFTKSASAGEELMRYLVHRDWIPYIITF